MVIDFKQSKKTLFIGVAGTPGSGKTFFADNLKNILLENHQINALAVSMDGYHYYRHELDKFDDPVEAHARRGAAFTFNAERFVQDMIKAKEQQKFDFPSFDHGRGDPEEEKIDFDGQIHEVVIVEGLYVLLK